VESLKVRDVKEVRNRRNYKLGYYTQEEFISGEDFECPDFWIRRAYTPEGLYLGDKKMAHFLCAHQGIKHFELAEPTDNICTIGFNPEEQKWYGWSHRAICGFGVGSVAQEGDCVTQSGWTEEHLAEHPEADKTVPVGFKAQNLEDAKKMAIAFADSVG
jgi:hypothetical protein